MTPRELLLDITAIPTAAGHEDRVASRIRRWVDERPDLILEPDPVGNVVIRKRDEHDSARPPVYITAHMDHPAFVVERILADAALQVVFRGGVMADFFHNAPIRLIDAHDQSHNARITQKLDDEHSPTGNVYLAELEHETDALAIGDIGVWSLPEPELDTDGILHTCACDDLAALVAALDTMDRLRDNPAGECVRLLFTRAEEIGFIGAIAACKHKTMPAGARVVALENSRASSEAPIGGGPIVRVGDRMSIFSPRLTAAIAGRAEDITGRTATPSASQKAADLPKRPWQRKLMAGGACEATVFCAYGYEATCICLPLGNYHNMAHLDELQAGTYDTAALGPPRAAHEYISHADYLGMVDLLTAIGQSLPEHPPSLERLEKLHADKAFVLA